MVSPLSSGFSEMESLIMSGPSGLAKAMNQLSRHSDFFLSNFEGLKSIFALLEQLDLSRRGFGPYEWRCYNYFITSYPSLLPTDIEKVRKMFIIANGEAIRAPKNRVVSRSVAPQESELPQNHFLFSPHLDLDLNFDHDEVDPEAKKILVHYLLTCEVQLSDTLPLDLFVLADKYDLPDLLDKALAPLLESPMSDEELFELLRAALKYNAPRITLRILKRHPDLFTSYPAALKRLLAAVEKKDLSRCHLTSEDWKTYAAFKKNYPSLFPTKPDQVHQLSVIINGVSFAVPKNDVVLESEKLRLELSFKPSANLNLDDVKVSLTAQRLLLDYLSTGQMEVTDKLPLEIYSELLKLADTYEFLELKQNIERALIYHLFENGSSLIAFHKLPLKTAYNLLEAALEFKTRKLACRCLFALCDVEFRGFVPKRQIRELLQDMKSIKVPFFMDPKEANLFGNYSPELLQPLQRLSRHLDIQMILDRQHSFNDKTLHNLLAQLPDLHGLVIENQPLLTTLSSENLKYINCRFCRFLESISAPSALKVSSTNNPRVKTFYVPNAKDFTCNDSADLTSVSLPEATSVFINRCPALFQLEAPKVVHAQLNNNPALKKISLLKAEEIYCNESGMEEIVAPVALNLNCIYSVRLRRIFAPMATRVVCKHSFSLTDLYAPRATILEIRGCSSLKIWQTTHRIIAAFRYSLNI